MLTESEFDYLLVFPSSTFVEVHIILSPQIKQWRYKRQSKDYCWFIRRLCVDIRGSFLPHPTCFYDVDIWLGKDGPFTDLRMNRHAHKPKQSWTLAELGCLWRSSRWKVSPSFSNCHEGCNQFIRLINANTPCLQFLDWWHSINDVRR